MDFSRCFPVPRLLLVLATCLTSVISVPAISNFNFPDPSIAYADGKWWAFATQTANSTTHVQVASSDDFESWSVVQNDDGSQYDALPTLPSWADSESPVWGPDVVKLDDGSFLMYYAAQKADSGSKFAVSAAKSQSVRGPYTSIANIMVLPSDSNGAFDAQGFKDWETKGDWTLSEAASRRSAPREFGRRAVGSSFFDADWSEGGKGGKRYIVYKIQNADGSSGLETKTPLTLQEVDSQDGVTLVGDPITLFDNDGANDANSIEAPCIVKTGDGLKYVLFFSKGNTLTAAYDVEYATADKVTGPWTRQGAILSTGDDGLNGPGGADVYWNGVRLMFHAINEPVGTDWDGIRVVHAGTIDLDGGSPKVMSV